MKRLLIVLSIFFFTIGLNAMTLKSGFNIVKSNGDFSLASTSLDGYITKIYGISSDASGYVSFDPSKSSFLNSLKQLKQNTYYLIVLSNSVESSDFSIDGNIDCAELKEGFNMLPLPQMNSITSTINGANITKIYGISSDASGYVSFDPSKSSFLNSLKSTEDGKAYIVVSASNSNSCSSSSSSSSSSSTGLEMPPNPPALGSSSSDGSGVDMPPVPPTL